MLQYGESSESLPLKRYCNNNFQFVAEGRHEPCLLPVCFGAAGHVHTLATSLRHLGEENSVTATGAFPEPPRCALGRKTSLEHGFTEAFEIDFELPPNLASPNQELREMFCIRLAAALKDLDHVSAMVECDPGRNEIMSCCCIFWADAQYVELIF